MPYIFQEQHIVDFAKTMNIQTRTNGNEIQFKECPYCKSNKKDQYTFGINAQIGVFNCFRASCGKSGHFVELARDFNFPIDFNNGFQKKKYKKLALKKPTPTPLAIQYLEKRGISKETLDKYNITTRTDMPNVLVFPFYDHTGEEMVFVKYRNTDPTAKNKEWCEKDTRPILFGMNNCTDFGTLVITEGQIDALSVYEAGKYNVVSVPTGATGFTWLDSCWEWIDEFKEIIVFGDYEKGKVSLIDTLSQRLDCVVKCVRNIDYMDVKDANEMLVKYQANAIVHAIEHAEIPRIDCVKNLSEVQSIDLRDLEKIKTGIIELDEAINGLYMGQVVVLTGKCGDGKSTFMSQVICEAVEQGFSTFVYSGELSDSDFKRWIDLQFAGPFDLIKVRNEYGREESIVGSKTAKIISEWYNERIWLYDNNYVLGSANSEFDGLLQVVEKCIKQYNVKLICLDNLMTALHVGDGLYSDQSNFVANLKKIAKKYNVVIILVAHPRKTQGNFQLENVDVSGSNDITNRVDIVMSYNRNLRDDDENLHDSELAITKNRLTGTILTGDNKIKLYYSAISKRIRGLNDDVGKVYSWKNVKTVLNQDDVSNILDVLEGI